MNDAGVIEFTLGGQAGRDVVDVQLRRTGERWIASLRGAQSPVGLGPSARAALRAALEPLGSEFVAPLLADVALLAPSRRVLDVERRAGG